jgi:hypothetical protein
MIFELPAGLQVYEQMFNPGECVSQIHPGFELTQRRSNSISGQIWE